MSKNRKRKKSNPLIHIAVLLAASLITAGIWFFSGDGDEGFGRRDNSSNNAVIELPPNMQEISFFNYFRHLDPNRFNAFIGASPVLYGSEFLMLYGELHIPADFLRQYIDRHIFWEYGSSRLTITDMDTVTRFTIDSPTFRINDEVHVVDFPVREVGGMAYMAASIIMERYPVDIRIKPAYNIVIIDFLWESRMFYEVDGSIEGWLPLRFSPGLQSPIQKRLHSGDRLDFFGVSGIDDEFLLVRTDDGLVGYVLEDGLAFIGSTPGITRPEEPTRPLTRERDIPVSLAWDLVTNHAAAADTSRLTAHRGLNVLSPTWFGFDAVAMNGDITSLANHDYVRWAHARGIEVWPMIWDADQFGHFSSAISRAVLSCAYVREHVIIQLMGFIERYNLDGIQVDYEVVQPDFAHYWIQFLRELAVPMRQQGAVLSVATKVPMAHNMFWNRTEIGLTADYIIIMAYDEHYAGARNAGSVSSYNFVRNGIVGTLREAQAERIILGLPFYERIWREEPQDAGEPPRVSVSRTPAMTNSRSQFTQRGANFEWDPVVRQYYAEYYITQGGVTFRYRVWMEDMRSMRWRIGLVREFGLAGTAGWSLGLELREVWDLIYDELH